MIFYGKKKMNPSAVAGTVAGIITIYLKEEIPYVFMRVMNSGLNRLNVYLAQ
jgi:hypothetical protein